ncbi:MAG: RDD family protein [Bryobacteraceae bacterium]
MFCPNCGSSMADGTAYCPTCGAAQQRAPVPAPGPPAAAAGSYPAVFAAGYASWGNRAVGFIIDGLLVGVGMAILYFFAAAMLAGIAGLAGHGAFGGMCCMFFLLFPVATLLVGLYNGVYLIALRGYSIGQGVVHIKVVDAAGNLLSQGTAFLRLVVRVGLSFVPFLPLLDMLWPLWDERGQTLHDKAVNCYVVNNPQGV